MTDDYYLRTTCIRSEDRSKKGGDRVITESTEKKDE